MKIKLDDKHYLNGDRFCCWITCEGVDKNGKQYEKLASGYSPTFGMAVERYIENRIRGDKITSITALKNEVRDLKKQVKEWKIATEDLR